MLMKTEPLRFYVYRHLTDDSRVFYVGKGDGKRTLSATKRNKKHRRITKQHGCQIDIMWETDDEEAAYAYEVQLISFFETFTADWKNGIECNFTLGGEGFRGNHTASSKRKMSIAKKGKPLSKQHRMNLSAANKGRKVTAVACANVSKSLKGKSKSPAHIIAMSKSRLGKKDSLETRAKKSLAKKGIPKTEACKVKLSLAKSGKKQPNITKALLGKSKSEECRKNISKAKMGKRMSDAACENMSKARAGKPWSLARRTAYEFSKRKKKENNDD